MTKNHTLLLLLASAAVLGGGLAINSAADAQTTGAAVVGAAGVDPRAGGFEIALGEWAISPEAPAIRPGPVTFVVRNRGKFRHGLELEIRRVDDHRDHDRGDDDAKSMKLVPGQSTRMTLNLAPGVYVIECFISHHDERGMRGTLEVREDAPLLKAPPKPAGTTVAISGFAYKPATLKTTVGKTVTWRNADTAPHTATASQFSSPQLAKGASFRKRFARAGTYAYVCALHPGMRGRIVVAGGTGR